jgi:two-component system chemotaxis response regulator CheB
MIDVEQRQPRRNVILVGASQGCIPALKTLLGGLPAGLRATVGITVHRSATFPSVLANILGAHSPLPVSEPKGGEIVEPGHVFLAPPDHHMVFRSGAVYLDRGPKQHHVRPSVDAMFMSGAKTFGQRVIGVLLTGNLSDGVSGLVEIKKCGGLSLAQDPREAEAPSMPASAILYDDVDAIFKMAGSASLLRKLVAGLSVEDASSLPA